ncbi:hypothetical protein COTS27_01063 [Spirochaetota bacterium]|nr:hypothetical protein COTS27_01063 [Spirochaetota bacterium]
MTTITATLFNYNFFLGLHIISMLSWMAGLFYVVRLFVYHSEALEQVAKKPGAAEIESEPAETKVLLAQFSLMERRLLGVIASPAMILTIITGFYIAIVSGAFAQSWLHWKLMLVFALVIYHFYSVGLMLKLRRGRVVMRSRYIRLFNEIAPVIFVGIVFLVTYKQPMLAVGGASVVIGVVLFIYLLFLLGKRLRGRTGDELGTD